MSNLKVANARERDRTHSVNTAFDLLRFHIPTEPKDRKLSKIEILRLASSYIAHLQAVLIAGIDQPCTIDKQQQRHQHQQQQAICTFCVSASKYQRSPLTPSSQQQQQQQPASTTTPVLQTNFLQTNYETYRMTTSSTAANTNNIASCMYESS